MKKFKLISTIASLCLAVALMAFGVYAATQVSVSISSTIKFNTKDNVVGTLTVKSYNIAEYTEKETTPTAPTIPGGATAMEEFTAAVNNNTGTVTASKAGETKDKTATISTDKVYVVYEVSFDSSTSDAPTLKVDNVSIKSNDTAVDASKAKVAYNGLSEAVTSKSDSSGNKYYIVVKILDTSADFTYVVDFTVTIASTANNNA